jgi:hypothetical protein
MEQVQPWAYVSPSSSTGKHHPEDENREYGQMFHIKKVVKLVNHLCRAFAIIGRRRDLLILAALIHDLAKFGLKENLGYTDPDHDVIMADVFKNTAAGEKTLTQNDINFVYPLLAGHMGPWGSNPDLFINNPFVRIIYIADYISSRKDVSVNIGPENKEK